MHSLKEIARAVGGEVTGQQVIGPGPGHGPRDRSLSIRLSADSPLGFLTHSFAGDDWRECRDLVKSKLGLHDDEPPPDDGDLHRTERAQAIWREAVDPRGTIVAQYLAGRGLGLPDGAASEAIRFHGNCPFGETRAPAMVALVRDIVTDRPLAIHRTALNADGSKATVDGKSKLALGRVAGGAVKLTPDAAITLCLGIAEGIETALSMREIAEFGGSPVWSVLNCGGMSNFPVLTGIETLWLGVDCDPAGLKASSAAAARWRGAGREAILIRPLSDGADINDLTRGAA
jgi:putative DNA primase/helicase